MGRADEGASAVIVGFVCVCASVCVSPECDPSLDHRAITELSRLNDFTWFDIKGDFTPRTAGQVTLIYNQIRI